MIESSCWLLSEKLGQTVAVFLPLCVAFCRCSGSKPTKLVCWPTKKKTAQLAEVSFVRYQAQIKIGCKNVCQAVYGAVGQV